MRFPALRPVARRASLLFLQVRGMATGIESKALTVELTKTPKQKLPKEQLKFGRTFSDHMLEIDWTLKEGWTAPHIKPYGNLSLSPAASCLHYALQCFEGMKAYLDEDGKVRLFRPELNMKRMNTSAARLCLPTFDGTEFLNCIKTLINIDKGWIPQGTGYSLYIRPTLISTHSVVGVTAPEAAKLYCILSPVGPYYPSGFAPVKLLTDTTAVRAWPGGTGNAKVGGNYALCIEPSQRAIKQGFSQILWLFGPNLEVTEVGTMNQFFYLKSKEGKPFLLTAPLDGTILPGVTRDSVIQLAKGWGIEVREQHYSLFEMMDAVKESRMLEAFGAGTAAVVCPVESFRYKDQDFAIPLGDDPKVKAGPLTRRLLSAITDIQYGKVKHEWSQVIG